MKKNLLILLTVIVLFIGGSIIVSKTKNEKENTVIINNDMPEVLLKYDYKEIFNENKSKNKDFKGFLVFESGIIAKPVVQGKTNDTYLRKDWETGNYDLYGSVFFDAINKADDRNLIIYGHNTFKDLTEKGELVFTPLELLLKEENYKENSVVYLCLENEIRKYQIASVYYCELENLTYARDDMQFNLPNYDNEYFPIYREAVKKSEFYKTGIEFTADDNLLTLQTCVKNDESVREIVIAKEIDRLSIDDIVTNDIFDLYYGG